MLPAWRQVHWYTAIKHSMLGMRTRYARDEDEERPKETEETILFNWRESHRTLFLQDRPGGQRLHMNAGGGGSMELKMGSSVSLRSPGSRMLRICISVLESLLGLLSGCRPCTGSSSSCCALCVLLQLVVPQEKCP